MARPKKPSTTSDLIRSLLVIIVPLVVITVLFTNVPDNHPVKVVDWQPVVQTARAQAPFPVLAPTNLPEGWRATQVSWVTEGGLDVTGQRSPRNQWDLGFLDPDDVYIGLTQADKQLPELIQEKTRDAKADGESSVGGQTWQRRISPDGRTRTLLEEDSKATTLVVGDLPYEALEAYAATLTTS